MNAFTSAKLAEIVNGTLEGSETIIVKKLAKLEEGDEESITFLANPKYAYLVPDTKAAVLIAPLDFPVVNHHLKAVIRTTDPYAAFTTLLSLFYGQQSNEDLEGIEQPSYLHESVKYGASFYLGAFAYISKGCSIGTGVKIHPQSFIGEGCEIADNTVIHAGAKVYPFSKIGKECIIHSGAVIGSDGFGFLPTSEGFKKIPQTGIVHIGDNVEIGANAVIDRATLGQTLLKDGVKIDNLVHIAHNVEIGNHTAIAAQTGVSGSTKIGNGVLIGGQVGIVGHIKIGDGVKINAQSGVSKSIEPKKSVSGSPATDFREHYKQLAWLKKIPELLKKIDLLENKLKKDNI
jgi:UDP-3-O-[3-hydroxymyristoyl] glucosamine N-acyltransferase